MDVCEKGLQESIHQYANQLENRIIKYLASITPDMAPTILLAIIKTDVTAEQYQAVLKILNRMAETKANKEEIINILLSAMSIMS